jgi:hypothetical protein
VVCLLLPSRIFLPLQHDRSTLVGMSQLVNNFREMLYFGCPFCGSENIYEFHPIRVCNYCQRTWSAREIPDFLPGQIIVRTMIGAPGFHHGLYLGCSGAVFHSTIGVGAHFADLWDFAQGRTVWARCEAARSAADLSNMWERARMKEGTAWTIGENCEDVAFYVRDGMGNSPTRNLLLGGLVCTALLTAAGRLGRD